MSPPTIDIDLFVNSDCPNAAPVRAQLLACLAARDLPWQLNEHLDTDHPSPTVLIAGRDVSPSSERGRGCRIALPGEAEICRALDRATGASR